MGTSNRNKEITAVMLYFAYGSNLSTPRLQVRVPSAQPVATGKLLQHRLVFHKIGRDGSAKCDAYFTGMPDDLLYGVVYRIHPDHKQELDHAEGLGKGYEIKEADIRAATGKVARSFLYFATSINALIKPFHWYKEHVLFGAREHCLPDSYIQKIAAVKSLTDTDKDRVQRELAIYRSRTK